MTKGGGVATAEDNRRAIKRFRDALYGQDYGALGECFWPDGEYTDAATPADDVAHGPSEIAARLQLAFGRLDELSDELRLLVAGDDAVFTEHVEHWRWPSGETMALPVVSVHELRDARITRWWDYWDMQVLVDSAPQWWFEHVMAGWK